MNSFFQSPVTVFFFQFSSTKLEVGVQSTIPVWEDVMRETCSSFANMLCYKHGFDGKAAPPVNSLTTQVVMGNFHSHIISNTVFDLL